LRSRQLEELAADIALDEFRAASVSTPRPRCDRADFTTLTSSMLRVARANTSRHAGHLEAVVRRHCTRSPRRGAWLVRRSRCFDRAATVERTNRRVCRSTRFERSSMTANGMLIVIDDAESSMDVDGTLANSQLASRQLTVVAAGRP